MKTIALTCALALQLGGCGKADDPQASLPSADGAYAVCRYFVGKTLPSGASVDWAPLTSGAATQSGDVWRVVVLYRVNQGSARATACRLRPEGSNWRVLSID